MNTLRPGLEELERTIFVRPLDLQRQEELESEVSYFERFLKNETAGDIRDCLGIPHSELWHRTKTHFQPGLCDLVLPSIPAVVLEAVVQSSNFGHGGGGGGGGAWTCAYP
ncbi:hypothetical protein AOL_s00078g447 [Orbilia oligospora ATCC 24927]|uniref:Uncharacterized protein n=1 Tax=Arthrobotrys oligospora (strain ATCC 24927 / CBS 115.81 / DSM 1491) TaxID=756982 RepID=G1XC00_ARTOA|nr:hypothetical protein AOL_s00078g447 [Orbilia oligospora ATCC 24927]EGX49414.1 hypothetical protein AOL_s00078g447 [Orbilia oligospora ATCC 24927]